MDERMVTPFSEDMSCFPFVLRGIGALLRVCSSLEEESANNAFLALDDLLYYIASDMEKQLFEND